MHFSWDYNDFITLVSNYYTGISCDGNKPAGQCVLNVAVDEILMSPQPLLSLELNKKFSVFFKQCGVAEIELAFNANKLSRWYQCQLI